MTEEIQTKETKRPRTSWYAMLAFVEFLIGILLSALVVMNRTGGSLSKIDMVGGVSLLSLLILIDIVKVALLIKIGNIHNERLEAHARTNVMEFLKRKSDCAINGELRRAGKHN